VHVYMEHPGCRNGRALFPRRCAGTWCRKRPCAAASAAAAAARIAERPAGTGRSDTRTTTPPLPLPLLLLPLLLLLPPLLFAPKGADRRLRWSTFAGAAAMPTPLEIKVTVEAGTDERGEIYPGV